MEFLHFASSFSHIVRQTRAALDPIVYVIYRPAAYPDSAAGTMQSSNLWKDFNEILEPYRRTANTVNEMASQRRETRYKTSSQAYRTTINPLWKIHRTGQMTSCINITMVSIYEFLLRDPSTYWWGFREFHEPRIQDKKTKEKAKSQY